MAGPAPGHGNGYPHRGMSPFSPPRRPVFRPPFLMLSGQVRGKGDLFGKRSPFPPHTPPILPKTFMQVSHGPSGAQSLPPPLVPDDILKKIGRMAVIPAMADTSRRASIFPSSVSTFLAGCRKTDALFKCGTILYKIRLLSCLFAKRGTIASPPDNGGDLTYRPEQKFYGGMGVRGKGDAFPKASPFPRPCLSRGPIPCPCS